MRSDDIRTSDRTPIRISDSESHEQDEHNGRTEMSLTAVYLDTAVDAGARIEDSTFPVQQRQPICDVLHPTTAEEATNG